MVKQVEWNGQDLPEWALQRVCDLTNVDGSSYCVGSFAVRQCQSYSIGKAFAAYIAAHEEPPVDPVDALVREEMAKAYDEAGYGLLAGRTRDGELDTGGIFTAAKALYLMGIEKGRNG